MKNIELAFSFLLAVAFAVGTAMLYSQAVYGAAGAMITGAILPTAVFSLLGGGLRVLLVFIAVAPPFCMAILNNYSGARERLGAWDALRDIFPASVLGLVLFVGLPVFLVYRFAFRRLPKDAGGAL